MYIIDVPNWVWGAVTIFLIGALIWSLKDVVKFFLGIDGEEDDK